MKTHLLTIDPGASGGFCLRHVDDVRSDTFVLREFTNAADFLDFMVGWAAFVPLVHLEVVIEAVHSSPVMGQASAFSFGKNYGLWLGMLAALRIKPLGISPQQWQHKLELAETQGSKRKSLLNFLAKQKHPTRKITLSTCDALHLSDFCIDHLKTTGRWPGKPIDL